MPELIGKRKPHVHAPRNSSCFLLLALMSLAGCAVPLGPGYRIQKETLDLHYAAASPVHLAVHATYRLSNVGNRGLDFVELVLPDEKIFGRRDAQARMDGREVALVPTPSGERGEFRISFNPPWPQKERHTLEIEYNLAPDPPGSEQISVSEGSFHLRSLGWFPDLQEAKGLFSIDVVRPDPTEVSVEAPDGFLLISRGKPAGERRQGAEVEHRFGVRRHDLDPFVVAGRYQEQRIEAADGSVIFWTFEPLPHDQAQAAGARLAATWELYQTIFGAASTPSRQSASVRIVETPANLPTYSGRDDGPAATALPGAVLLNRQAFLLGVASTEFLDLAERAMVGTWIGQQVSLRPEAAWTMRQGLEGYASMAAAAAQGRARERPLTIAALLRDYDEARAGAVEKPLAAIRMTDPQEQRRIDAAKVQLFFLALEDECGQAPVRRAMADLVGELRGQDVGWSDLRAALERETGKSLAPFFRGWLEHVGIPDEFRSRNQRIENRQ